MGRTQSERRGPVKGIEINKSNANSRCESGRINKRGPKPPGIPVANIGL